MKTTAVVIGAIGAIGAIAASIFMFKLNPAWGSDETLLPPELDLGAVLDSAMSAGATLE